jgi:hypothetical protein
MTTTENLISLNVHGLRDGKKCREIFRWLKKIHNGKNALTLLQETHSSAKDEGIWEKEWGSKIIFSHGSTNSCGVAILFPHAYDSELINYENMIVKIYVSSMYTYQLKITY